MANHSITVTNSFRALGHGTPSLWGVMVWGVDLWGNTNDTRFYVEKWLSDSVYLSQSTGKATKRAWADNLSLGSSINFVSLSDAAGYTYILQGGAVDPDDRVLASYVSSNGLTPTYTVNTLNNPSWSEA